MTLKLKWAQFLPPLPINLEVIIRVYTYGYIHLHLIISLKDPQATNRRLGLVRNQRQR